MKNLFTLLLTCMAWCITTAQTPNPFPANGATDVPFASQIVIDFGVPISLMEGVSSSSITVEPRVSDSRYIDINSNKLYIGTTTYRMYGATMYTVTIPPNVLNGYPQGYTWSFTTEAPIIAEFYPLNSATDVPVAPNLELAFTTVIKTVSDLQSRVTISPAATLYTIRPDGEGLIIPHANLTPNTTYTVTIPSGTIIGYNEEIKWTFTTAGLQIVSQTPAPGATNVEGDAPISITYNQASINAGSAFYNINMSPRPGTFDPYFERVGGVQTGATTGTMIFDHSTLLANTEYTITIPANAIAGYNEAVTWKFTTAPPKYTSTTPADKAMGVALDAAVSVEFNQALPSGNINGITINGAAAIATASDTTLIINHDPFDVDQTYTVLIPAGVITGITTPITWSFSTSPSLTASTVPSNGRSDVALAPNVEVRFNQAVTLANQAGVTFTPAITGVNLWYDSGNNKLVIGHDAFTVGTKYTVNIAAGTFTEITSPISFWFTTVAPAVTAKSPADGASGVEANAPVSVTFNGNIVETSLPISGITISSAGTNPTSVTGTVSGNVLTIDHGTFTAGTEYTVNIPSDVIMGYSSPITWKFVTAAPAGGIFSPAAAATNVAVDAPVSVTFGMNITKGTDEIWNSIKITHGANNEEQKGVAGTLSGNKINIDHAVFAGGTNYTVTIPANAITALATPITWNFTTAAPVVSSRLPDLNATGVSVNAPVSITFDKDIITTSTTGVKITSTAGELTGVTATPSGKTLKITHSAFTPNTVYTVTIPVSTVSGVTTAITWSFTTEAVGITSRTPGENATNVAVGAPVTVTFGDNITGPCTGITISSANVSLTGVSGTINGKVLTIAHPEFTGGTQYTVSIPATAINGISAPISWSFTTAAPVVSARTPGVDATNVALNAVITVDFDKIPVKGANFEGGITINADDGSGNINGVDGMISGKRLTITHSEFAGGKKYTVIIPANAIVGISSPITWSFTTANPKVTSKLPVENATEVALDAAVTAGFDQDIAQGENFGDIAITAGGVKLLGLSPSTNGKTLTILHNEFAAGTEHTVNIPANAISGVKDAISWKFTAKAPVVSAMSPADGSSGVSTDVPITVTFSTNVTAGNMAGITITPAISGAITGSVVGKELTITHPALAAGTQYTVTVPANAIAGLAAPVSWKFTTKEAGVSYYLPAANAANVAVDATVAVTFDNVITAGNLSGIIISSAGGKVNNVVGRTSGNTLTISHEDFAAGTAYTVTVPAGAISGINNPVSWSFTTVSPSVTAQMPANGATNVPINATVALLFDKKVTLGTTQYISFSPKVNITGVTVSNNELIIAHDDFVAGTDYTITVPPNAVLGMYSEAKWSFKTVAPGTPTTSPANDATGVAVNADLTVTFDKNITEGAKIDNITISPSINVIGTDVNGKSLTIQHDRFQPGTKYTVTVPGNAVSGYTSAIVWSFTTRALQVQAYTPGISETNVALDASVSVTFNTNISKATGAGNINFTPSVNAWTSTDGAKLIISHDKFASATTYTITIPANYLDDQASPITWTFTTEKVTGADDWEKLNAEVYPNPVQTGTQFTVQTKNTGNAPKVIEVINTAGAVISKTETSDSLVRLTAPKQQGVYLLRITCGVQVGVYRVVVH